MLRKFISQSSVRDSAAPIGQTVWRAGAGGATI